MRSSMPRQASGVRVLLILLAYMRGETVKPIAPPAIINTRESSLPNFETSRFGDRAVAKTVSPCQRDRAERPACGSSRDRKST